jgi:hypothetical protein
VYVGCRPYVKALVFLLDTYSNRLSSYSGWTIAGF